MFYYRNIFSLKTAQNPLVIVAVLFVTALLSACGGTTAPAQPAGPGATQSLQVVGGTFVITAEIIFDTCNSSQVQAGAYEITIDEATFAMGTDWVGTWDAKNATGVCESERVRETIRFCTKTTWTEANVTFFNEDEFSGEIIYRRRVDGECSTVCTTTWRIRGERQPAAP